MIEIKLTEDEANFITECVYMASREGFYSITHNWEKTEEVGHSVLEKLGFDKKTAKEYMDGY